MVERTVEMMAVKSVVHLAGYWAARMVAKMVE